MTLAKGLGGGVPIGAFLSKDHCAVFGPGDHGSTYGGNPLVCAAAYAVVKYMVENDVPGNARRVGARLLESLGRLKSKYPSITDVRGRGLLVAIEFDREIAQDVMMACLKEGLWTNRVKPNAIRMMPPLIIGDQEVTQAVAILDKVLTEMTKAAAK
jgi:acetylornithine/N-succinyldiaminopimelate aminotransferase